MKVCCRLENSLITKALQSFLELFGLNAPEEKLINASKMVPHQRDVGMIWKFTMSDSLIFL